MPEPLIFPDIFPMPRWIWDRVIERLDLPPQQSRLVQLIVMRFQDTEIATELEISTSTVRTYLGRIFQRTETKDRIDLVITIFSIALEIQSHDATDNQTTLPSPSTT